MATGGIKHAKSKTSNERKQSEQDFCSSLPSLSRRNGETYKNQCIATTYRIIYKRYITTCYDDRKIDANRRPISKKISLMNLYENLFTGRRSHGQYLQYSIIWNEKGMKNMIIFI